MLHVFDSLRRIGSYESFVPESFWATCVVLYGFDSLKRTDSESFVPDSQMNESFEMVLFSKSNTYSTTSVVWFLRK